VKGIVLLLTGACLGLGGCGGEPSLKPPVVHYGQAVCHVCGMIVSDERFAAAMVTIEDGRRREYVLDDVGELGDLSPPPGAPCRRYVHDMQSLEWIDAHEAHYLRSGDLHTPMGTGVGAFATLEDAEAARASRGGEVLTYESLFGPDR